MSSPPSSSGERLLTFGSGGWALALAAVVTFGLTFWALAPAMFGPPRPPGNGRDIETFEFDLTGLAVDRAYVVPAMHHRDIIEPMDEPIILEGQTIAALNEERRKYLVPLEEVIGVVVNGAARAYPISVLNVHEVIHDDLGGRPIAVTWHWPCGSIAVFDREVNGRVLEFGVSGLVYNSNMLLYERRGDDAIGGESLWNQMLGRAVSGPPAAAGETLTRIPATLTTWGRWLELHPSSTVVDRDPNIIRKRYTKGEPTQYYQRGQVLFPVEHAVPPDLLPPLTRVVVVDTGSSRRVYPLPLLIDRAGESRTWTDDLDGVPLEFAVTLKPQLAEVTSPDRDLTIEHAVWFAWHAFHPEDQLAR